MQAAKAVQEKLQSKMQRMHAENVSGNKYSLFYRQTLAQAIALPLAQVTTSYRLLLMVHHIV